MPFPLLFALLIVGALNKDLGANLEDKLKECTNILNHAHDFYGGLPKFNDRRRLADSDELEDDVEKSLDTCMAVVQAVHNFYEDSGEQDVETGLKLPWEDPIVLNVGGTHFSTTLATLQSKNGTFFEKMFRQGATTTCSADGTFFIDRNPKTFEYILDFLRTGDMLVKSEDASIRSQLLEDAEFFELPEELKEYLRLSSLASIDLSFSEVTWLNKQLPSNIKLGGLLFDTSKDGSAASTFHNRCDGEGATVTIIETTLGVLFGGYTDQSWSSSAGWVTDTDAFVFRLRPSPEKFKVSSSTNAIYRHSSYGPRFGNTAIIIYTDCQNNADSYVSSGSYYDIGNFVLNDGHSDFRCKNFVVVQAV